MVPLPRRKKWSTSSTDPTFHDRHQYTSITYSLYCISLPVEEKLLILNSYLNKLYKVLRSFQKYQQRNRNSSKCFLYYQLNYFCFFWFQLPVGKTTLPVRRISSLRWLKWLQNLWNHGLIDCRVHLVLSWEFEYQRHFFLRAEGDLQQRRTSLKNRKKMNLKKKTMNLQFSLWSMLMDP